MGPLVWGLVSFRVEGVDGGLPNVPGCTVDGPEKETTILASYHLGGPC